LIERTATALGHVCLGERPPPFLSRVLEQLFALSKLSYEDVHFATGEALSVIGAGWSSAAAYDPLVPEKPPATPDPYHDIMKQILIEILKVHYFFLLLHVFFFLNA
jgi:hypothetical protein